MLSYVCLNLCGTEMYIFNSVLSRFLFFLFFANNLWCWQAGRQEKDEICIWNNACTLYRADDELKIENVEANKNSRTKWFDSSCKLDCLNKTQRKWFQFEQIEITWKSTVKAICLFHFSIADYCQLQFVIAFTATEMETDRR